MQRLCGWHACNMQARDDSNCVKQIPFRGLACELVQLQVLSLFIIHDPKLAV